MVSCDAVYTRKLGEIDAQLKPLREQVSQIEAPYRERLKAEALKKYPGNVQQAVAKPENERTPGEAFAGDADYPERSQRRSAGADALSET